MGYGGLLMWTAVFRELKKRNKDKKIVFATKPNIKDKILRKKFSEGKWSVIFDNNPDISHPDSIGKNDDIIIVDFNNKDSHYWHETTDEKQIFKTEGHAIEIACKVYGISNPDIKCELYLTDKEEETAERIASRYGEFIVVEPNAKDEFTVNKSWDIENWQKVVDGLKDDITIVQVGQKGGALLGGVESVVGELTFRETAALIKKSRLLVTIEGGLMHAANAVGTKAVVVYTGYISPIVTGYKENTNLYPKVECGNCGLRKPCPIDAFCKSLITPDMVINSTRSILNSQIHQ